MRKFLVYSVLLIMAVVVGRYGVQRLRPPTPPAPTTVPPETVPTFFKAQASHHMEARQLETVIAAMERLLKADPHNRIAQEQLARAKSQLETLRRPNDDGHR